MKRLLSEFGYYLIGTTTMLTGGPTRFIFILAMARSGSTLLAHIIAGNPDIEGIGETKTKISSSLNLPRVVGKTRLLQWRHGIKSTSDNSYFADKLVHNRLLDPQHIALLNDDRFKIIFLLREPLPTIQSHIKAIPDATEEMAIRAYERRAKTIKNYMKLLAQKKKCLALTYNQLTNCSQDSLHMIGEYLELSTPLKERYETTEATGKFSLGDNSNNIKTGKIVRTPQAAKERAPIDQNLLRKATKEYEACLKLMETYCICLDQEACSADS